MDRQLRELDGGFGVEPRERTRAVRRRRRRAHLRQPHLAATRDRTLISRAIGSSAAPGQLPARGARAAAGRLRDAPRAPVAVVNLIGRVFMDPRDCPFRAADASSQRSASARASIFVDMHAEATSEKLAMGWLPRRPGVSGRRHPHARADRRRAVLPGGTAYMTDAGMCGPLDSVIGMRTEQVAEALRRPAAGALRRRRGRRRCCRAVAIDVDETTRPGAERYHGASQKSLEGASA